jgi:hypothetical protein
MDPKDWVLDRIVDLFPGTTTIPSIAMASLVEAIAALRGIPGKTVFGMMGSLVDEVHHPAIMQLLQDALQAWQEWAVTHQPGLTFDLDEP